MQWTIQRKLTIGFVVAGGLLAGCVGFAHWAQSRAQATQAQMTKTFSLLNDFEHLSAYLGHAQAVHRGYVISGDDSKIAALASLRQDAGATMARVTAAVKDDPEQNRLFAAWTSNLSEGREYLNRMDALRKSQGFDAARVLFATGEDDQLTDKQSIAFDAMKQNAMSRLNLQEAANAQLQSRIAWIEILSLLVALSLLTGVATTLMRSIARNIHISLEMVETMAQKDLTLADGEPATNDELAGAIYAINRLKLSMTQALSEVAQTSAQVAGAGVEIEAAARQMAETTHRERKDMEMFASSLAQMNATVKEVADHASRASVAAGDAVSSAGSGRKMAQQAQEAMNRIHESVITASNDIAALGKVTESIGEVVRIIQEIAEQTNLLALNASIEAARAGEQGRGFAVVAQEVRQLAERTSNFTQEIADKITSVQQGAGRAVASMKQGETVVSEGVRQFNAVNVALETIMQKIETAQTGISMIATATIEQSSATGELNESIHGISSEVDKSTRQVDQTVTECAELARLAAGMQILTDTFKLPAEIKSAIDYGSPRSLTRAA